MGRPVHLQPAVTERVVGPCESCRKRIGSSRVITHHMGRPILCDVCCTLRTLRIKTNVYLYYKVGLRIESMIAPEQKPTPPVDDLPVALVPVEII